MKTKRFFSKIWVLIAVVASLGLSSCAKFKQIRPTSIDITEIKPHSFRSFGIKLDVGVNNPASQLKFTETLGTIYYSGEEIGTLTVDPFIFEGRKESIFPLQLNVNLISGFQVLKLLNALRDSVEMEKITLDISTKARLKCGISKRMEYKGLPASAVVERMKPLLEAKINKL